MKKAPNINCTKCKKGKCTYWRHVKECLLIAGKYCGANQHYKMPKPSPPPPLKRESRPNRINHTTEELKEFYRKMKEVLPITTKLEMDHLLLKEKDKVEILLEAIAGDILLCEEMAQTNHHQSLERLNERGGMSYGEIYCNIHELSLGQLRAFPNLDYCMKVELIIDMQKEP